MRAQQTAELNLKRRLGCADTFMNLKPPRLCVTWCLNAFRQRYTISVQPFVPVMPIHIRLTVLAAARVIRGSSPCRGATPF